MKKKVGKTLMVISAIIITSVLLYSIYHYHIKKENFDACEKNEGSSSEPMPESAAEACKKISSKAAEIEAHYGGIAKVIGSIPVLNLFSPSSYKAGDNKTDDMMRNIVNTNLSKCEVEQISNSCSSIATGVQSNVIDTTSCYICTNVNPSLCVVSGNVQINDSTAIQSCNIKIAIKLLSDKKTSVDAQALAKVLQKADGLMSGNNIASSENCNIISQDLSTKSYLEQKSDCLNTLNLDQQNILKGCAFIGNVQKNISKNIQQCVIGTETVKKDTVEADVKTTKTIEVEQESTGINTVAMAISSVTSLCSSSMAVVVLYFASTFDYSQFKEE